MYTYCIVQESPYDQQHILGLLLSLELYDKNATCVVCCSENTQKYIKAFPKPLALHLDFAPAVFERFDCLDYIKNICHTLNYSVATYKDCVLLNKELVMTNPLVISAEVKTQGIGFIRKTIQVANEAAEFQRYSLSLLYVRELVYVNSIIKHYETELSCPDLFQFVREQDQDKEQVLAQEKKLLKIYAELPLCFVNQFTLTAFLTDYSYVGTEDFFAYENSLKIGSITQNLAIQETPIAFCNIRTDSLDKKIQQLNTYFLNILVRKHICYMSLLNLKMSGNKLQFIVPKRKAVGIWDRTHDNGGLYELIDFWATSQKSYLSQVEVEIDYFSFGNYLLTDKPAHIWLNNSIKKYTRLGICNYDTSLQAAVSTLPIPHTFLFYYAYFPVRLEAFLQLEEVVEKTVDYVSVHYDSVCKNAEAFTLKEAGGESVAVDFLGLLARLRAVKYGYMDQVEMPLLATYLALGVVPIINAPLYDLAENVHYLTQPTEAADYTTMRQNCLTYYAEHMAPAACLKKLLDFIFVRDL